MKVQLTKGVDELSDADYKSVMDIVNDTMVDTTADMDRIDDLSVYLVVKYEDNKEME